MKTLNIKNFLLIIGSMKCGTTSLFNYLATHPEISASKVKEPEFFTKKSSWEKGFDFYTKLWDYDEENHKFALEASTNYSKISRITNAADRIYQIRSEQKVNFKFIYIIRNYLPRWWWAWWCGYRVIQIGYTHRASLDTKNHTDSRMGYTQAKKIFCGVECRVVRFHTPSAAGYAAACCCARLRTEATPVRRRPLARGQKRRARCHSIYDARVKATELYIVSPKPALYREIGRAHV